MKKVLIISNIPSPYRTALYAYLQEHQKDVRFQVLYTSRIESDRAWTQDSGGLKDTYFQSSKVLSVKGGKIGGTATRFIHIPQGLEKMLGSLSPDVIIGSEYNLSAVQALLWAKRHGVPFINLTDGTLRSETYIGAVQKFTRKLIISRADAFLASSTKAREKLLHWGAAEEKIAISYLTVPAAPFLQLQREPEMGRILYVGRISHEKGLDLLVDALAQTHAPWALRVVGNDVGGEKQLVQSKIDALGLTGRVQFLGYKEGAALLEEYSKASVLAVPSRSDCFGLILVEGGCAGVPIAASCYADGAYDVITPGVNGLLADPEDPAAFSSCLDALLEKPLPAEGLRETLGEKFSFQRAAEGYFQALRIAEGRKSHGEYPNCGGCL